MSDRVAFDWDDCLVDVATKLWLPGSRSAIEDVRARGYEPFVHTCRANWAEGRAEVEALLREAHLDLEIVAKPEARFYVDDRALEFAGNWRQTLASIPPTRKVIRELQARALQR